MSFVDQFNPLASEGEGFYTQSARVDMTPDDVFADLNDGAGGLDDVDPIEVLMDRMRSGFKDPVQESGMNSGPQAAQPTPAQQAGLNLQQSFDRAMSANRPLQHATSGQTFTASGTGAQRLDTQIKGQEQNLEKLEANLQQFKDLNPQSDPDRAQPEAVAAEGGPGIGAGAAKLALNVAVPILPIAAAVGGLLKEVSGAGSFVTFTESANSGSRLESDAGYGASASAVPRSDIMQPQQTVAVAPPDLMGNINHIVEPGFECKPGEFDVEEIRDIQDQLAQWKHDTREARQAFESWKQGPLQVTDLNDVKEIPAEALKASGDQMANLTSDNPALREQPFVLTSGAKMMG
ncbi:MAG: hypothetical protein H6867_02485 [Rhodospirillales bacterium]|nr:hypothetical protein [Rhodospirillales bacterium]MCB9997057.1 hypothetical protein [Rhodospirillales bacterium]